VVFCTTDIPPNGVVPMHRTISLDYGAVISGEIVLKLDGGEEKTLRAGDFIVQRGVNHQWINRSNGVCRILAVMVASEKIVLNGETLEETVFKKPGN
jgi:quercetin dioxygenase-like cupin family protein